MAIIQILHIQVQVCFFCSGAIAGLVFFLSQGRVRLPFQTGSTPLMHQVAPADTICPALGLLRGGGLGWLKFTGWTPEGLLLLWLLVVCAWVGGGEVAVGWGTQVRLFTMGKEPPPPGP
jgi:hypothetical protein